MRDSKTGKSLKGGLVLKKLSSYVVPYWKSYLFAVVCLFTAIGLEMLSPQVSKLIVNEVFVAGDFHRFGWLLDSPYIS